MQDQVRQIYSTRDRPEWMTSLDERILELIAIEGNMTPLALSADDIPRRLPVDRRTVSHRCQHLSERGYLDEHPGELYSICDRSREFLCDGY